MTSSQTSIHMTRHVLVVDYSCAASLFPIYMSSFYLLTFSVMITIEINRVENVSMLNVKLVVKANASWLLKCSSRESTSMQLLPQRLYLGTNM